MRRVLRRVREEQGPDAVILSNRRVEDGIEVIAAVDYDEALMQHALGRDPAAAAAAPVTDRPAERPAANLHAGERSGRGAAGSRSECDAADARRASEALAASRVLEQALPASCTETDLDFDLTPIAIADPSLTSVRAEISSLRGLLETQVSSLLWADGTRRAPQLAEVLRNLARLGISPDVARSVVGRLGPLETLKNTWQQPMSALSQLIPVTGSSLITDGGVAALIGPTGVGKTTTIAKLAVRYAMANGADDIALVCAEEDNFALSDTTMMPSAPIAKPENTKRTNLSPTASVPANTCRHSPASWESGCTPRATPTISAAYSTGSRTSAWCWSTRKA